MTHTTPYPQGWKKRGAPLRYRLLGMLRRLVSDSKGAWAGLDLRKISVTLECSTRQIQRVLNEIRDEEVYCREFVFRSANKATGRGRQVLICCDDWYHENDREIFARTADGKSRSLRESFQPGADKIEGVEFEAKGPSDISKDKASKEANPNNTRKSSSNTLRVLSFSFARQLLKQGWEGRFKRLNLTIKDLSNITHKAFIQGYWRDDVESCLAKACRIADSAASDGLARSPIAYAVHIFKLELLKVRKSVIDCQDRARKYWIDQVILHQGIVNELKKQFGADYSASYPPRLVDACRRYNLVL